MAFLMEGKVWRGGEERECNRERERFLPMRSFPLIQETSRQTSLPLIGKMERNRAARVSERGGRTPEDAPL